MRSIVPILAILLLCGCSQKETSRPSTPYLDYSKNSLDYTITPNDVVDKSGLMFSDQGAWFAYSFPKTTNTLGFSGPFLLTQQNGIWSSPVLSELVLTKDDGSSLFTPQNNLVHQRSFASHLERLFQNKTITLQQELVFLSGHTALIKTWITNRSDKDISLRAAVKGQVNAIGISLSQKNKAVLLTSDRTNAIGYIKTSDNPESINIQEEGSYAISLSDFVLRPGQSREILFSQTFIFPEYSWKKEERFIGNTSFDSILDARKLEKNNQLKQLIDQRKPQFQDSSYAEVLAKAHLTLQNNWRIPAGEIKHQGLFPSYHYKWFNGFWSWDSWKHAVGLSHYNTALAKAQMKLMFEFQNEDGFVADCVYRDTTLEVHNYRDTKPPLAAWAVAKITEKDRDIPFVEYMYPKLKKYHYWWYHKRDHDQDGLCEYGSTDGSLIAAKWESGMDNAIRFDHSKILKNGEGAYSLDQESVDLNAYLYAEKLYLTSLAQALGKNEDVIQYEKEAEDLKTKIQQQFYDVEDGWFYDTDLKGTTFIKGEGSEGWTALWANAASQEQAASVKNLMLDPHKFFTKVPFQTMSADHPKFDPLKGYWRGPNWLDQAYFGVKSLRNYGFHKEADDATRKILEGAEGLMDKGTSIRENYHPLTGQGLHAKNFSWSAAHIIMLLSEE